MGETTSVCLNKFYNAGEIGYTFGLSTVNSNLSLVVPFAINTNLANSRALSREPKNLETTMHSSLCLGNPLWTEAFKCWMFHLLLENVQQFPVVVQ